MNKSDRSWLGRALESLQPILAVLLGLAVGLAFTRFAGESPIHVLKVLYQSAFGSSYDLGMTLFHTTPLIFTGLSVAIAFHAGLFNIGAEGQLIWGALAAAVVGHAFPHLPGVIAPWVAVSAAVLAGAIWGAIPGWLRARRGSHEVINTIMFNFIAAGITSWLVIEPLRNPDTQNPETAPIGEAFLLAPFRVFDDAPVGPAFLLAVMAAFLLWLFLNRTSLGYELRAVGQNEHAARTAGIDIARIRIFAMAVAGGLAGLVAVGEVLGNAGRFKVGFSPDYGFMGVAVALLARNHPIGILFAAFVFGALHKGAMDLDLETENVTRDLALVLQACVILSVSAEGAWHWLKRVGSAGKKRG
jgi:simple sugar transport system permease protein